MINQQHIKIDRDDGSSRGAEDDVRGCNGAKGALWQVRTMRVAETHRRSCEKFPVNLFFDVQKINVILNAWGRGLNFDEYRRLVVFR